tara:strand:- start:811 stop:1032 length:222 start_codon:yes stop_codon:yes gene_type:complete
MSRNEFKNFIKSLEHNILLKEKLAQCKTFEDLIFLAKRYGYSITLEDLKNDKTATKFGLWYKESRINPLNFTR